MLRACLVALIGLTTIMSSPAPALADAAEDEMRAISSAFYKAWDTNSIVLNAIRSYVESGTTTQVHRPEIVMKNYDKLGTLKGMATDCDGKFKKLIAAGENARGKTVKTWCEWIKNPKQFFVDHITANMLYGARLFWIKSIIEDYPKKGWINVNALGMISDVPAFIKKNKVKYKPFYDKLGATFDAKLLSPLTDMKARLDKVVEANLDTFPVKKSGKHDKRVAKKLLKKYPKVADKGAYRGKNSRSSKSCSPATVGAT